MSLACLETPRRLSHSRCWAGRRCKGGRRMCQRLPERGRLWCWARCVMHGKDGRKGLQGRSSLRGPRRGSSFISLMSLIPFASLFFSLCSCTRSVPTEPGVVNFLIESMPTNLDPRIGTDGPSERIDGLIFDSLVELDAQRIPHGDLAETWETPDPVTYIFHLRSGVKFHDGRVLTSADVKYTF